jgi:hypothetical protein
MLNLPSETPDRFMGSLSCRSNAAKPGTEYNVVGVITQPDRPAGSDGF